MRCRSGNHEWLDELDATRCCSPEFRREMRSLGEEDDLLPEGRTYRHDMPFVYGWVVVPAAAEVGR